MEKALELRTRQVGPWDMNTYALVCPTTRHSVLIDPGADPDALREMLAGTQPQAIWVTHHHGDHIGALDEMRDRLGVPVMAHPLSDFGKTARPADAPLSDGDALRVGQHTVRVDAAAEHYIPPILLFQLGQIRHPPG